MSLLIASDTSKVWNINFEPADENYDGALEAAGIKDAGEAPDLDFD